MLLPPLQSTTSAGGREPGTLATGHCGTGAREKVVVNSPSRAPRHVQSLIMTIFYGDALLDGGVYPEPHLVQIRGQPAVFVHGQ